MAELSRARDHERSTEPGLRTQPAPLTVVPTVSHNRNIPFEATDITPPAQHTATIAGGAVMTFVHPRQYSNPMFSCSIFNVGPGMVSARWDGRNAVFGAPECVLLPPMTGYAEAGTQRMSIAADGTGATVSISCESFYGRGG